MTEKAVSGDVSPGKALPNDGTTGKALPGRAFSWRFTTPLFIGSALNPINSSLLATALVPIAHGLGVPPGQTVTLVTALYLATAVAQPTAGKAAEVFGPRRVFLTGIVLVALGGLVGGFAQNLPTLLVSRVLIGLGTSCAYPTAMLLIRRRARDAGLEQPPGGVLGGLQIAGIATASLGLPIGGLLVGLLGWRSVFFINVPVAVIALVATLLWVSPDGPVTTEPGVAAKPGTATNRDVSINRSPATERGVATKRSPATERGVATKRSVAAALDVVGILGFTAAMTALLVFLFGLPSPHWPALGVSIVLWAALIWWELRASTPFLDIRLLVTNRPLTSTYVRFGLMLLCGYVVLYGLTQWVETARGLSETAAGLLLLPMTLVSGLVIIPISRRNLVRGPVITAALTCLAGSVGVLFLNQSLWIGWIVLLTIVFGVAMGTTTTGNQTALYAQAPADQLGTASGLLRTFGYVGSIGASAITGIVFHSSVTDHGLHEIGWIMVGVSLALTALSLTGLRVSSQAAGQA